MGGTHAEGSNEIGAHRGGGRDGDGRTCARSDRLKVEVRPCRASHVPTPSRRKKQLQDMLAEVRLALKRKADSINAERL